MNRLPITLMFCGALASLAAGCMPSAAAPSDPDLVRAQKEAIRAPANRFVVAGIRQFPNGTEVYVLDGKSGQVCYYFVASGQGDDKAQKTDMRACAGEALMHTE